ncbi:MAG: sensor histidine kinase [Lachnospiraceae bacterium]|nr:sensor histidine kinase [Robinsoniella sp.]MDY3765239.1 sensor histidine kinase [Lachnospiraceae bacterium]
MIWKWFENWWYKIKNIYVTRSLQFLISISFTLVTVIGMIFLGLFSYKGYNSSSQNILMETNQKLLDQVEINLTMYLRNMMRISDSMYYSVIKNMDLASENMDKEMNLLYEANKDNLVSLACFKMDGTLVGSVPYSNLKSNVDVTQQDWFIQTADKMENLHFSDFHVQNLFENTNGRYYWVISLSRGVELTYNGNMEMGILLVDMDFSGIKQLFTKANNQELGYIYLIDSNGKIIYHPKQNLIFSNLLRENNQRAATYDDGIYWETFGSEERMVVVKTVGYTGWKIVSVTPKDEISEKFSQNQVMVMVIMILAICLIVFANQLVSLKIVQPIKKLEESVKKIEKEDSTDIYIGGPHEIQHLGQSIQSMVEEMRQLADDIVVEQEKKRKSELDALQSQINPHFLYNTLDSIMWMIEAEQYEDAISMVQALGKLLRISLSKGKNIITIGDEMEHARNYLDIQKFRYKNKFTAFFEIEKGIEKYMTIKLIIQPLIENAIYYGMEFMDGDGEIYIRAYSCDEDIYLEVEDNGLGMPQKQVEHLLTDNTRVRSKGSGIGLRNVHQRIQLYFGESYGLSIMSEPDEGTLIRIHLPKTEEYMEQKKEERHRER